MRKDHHAEDDRNKTRGLPRPGNALVHGLGYCGAGGHTMVVQYQGGLRAIGHYLRHQDRTPVCPYLAAEPGDTRGGDAFCQALSPVALAGYAPAWAQRQQQAERIAHAQAPPLERRRSAAAYGARQCYPVDPAHRHGAAEVAPAWELALQALKQAEAAAPQRAQSGTPPAQALSPTRQAACRASGPTRPARWPPDGLSQAQRQAVLRWLMEQVVSQRARRDQIHTRIVWPGGATTPLEGPGAVGARTELPTAPEMAQQIRGLFAEGTSDDAMARQRTQHGYRSPSPPSVLPSTVKGSRRKLGLMQQRSQSPPRRLAGALTVPQLAQAWGIPPHWV
jgi:hypothetical protein